MKPELTESCQEALTIFCENITSETELALDGNPLMIKLLLGVISLSYTILTIVICSGLPS